MAGDAVGMKGYRSRNDGGELRQKRADTFVSTIEKNYGVDFPFNCFYKFYKESYV